MALVFYYLPPAVPAWRAACLPIAHNRYPLHHGQNICRRPIARSGYPPSTAATSLPPAFSSPRATARRRQAGAWRVAR